MRPVVFLVTLALLGGCHARFKKHVDQIDLVRPQILVSGGPMVEMGGADTESDVVDAVVGVVQGVRGIQAAERIAGAVKIDKVNRGFVRGLTKALGDGPPFGTTPEQGGPLLQVEVLGYGLVVPVMGMPGYFTYDTRVEIYLKNGDKVYKTRHTCSVPFGDAMPISVATGTVDNVKQLEQMSDAEIQDVFEEASRACGEDLVVKMRDHAS